MSNASRLWIVFPTLVGDALPGLSAWPLALQAIHLKVKRVKSLEAAAESR